MASGNWMESILCDLCEKLCVFVLGLLNTTAQRRHRAHKGIGPAFDRAILETDKCGGGGEDRTPDLGVMNPTL